MADTTTTSTTGLPSWMQPYAAGYLNRAQSVADSPYQAYTGQRVAGMTPWQDQGYAAQAQRAMSGSSVMNAANPALQGMFSQTQGATANPYGYAQSAGTNAYAGSNPYLQQNIDSALGDVSRNWNNIQKPAWDSAMQRSGSYGNSGIAQANQMAASDTQRNMGQIASQMRMQDYGMQQQLAESQLARTQQNNQFNASMGEQFAGRQDSMYGQNQNRQLSALGMAPTYAANDYADIAQLQNAGSAYQNQNQKLLDNAYQQFLDSRNYPQQQLDTFGNALGRLNWGSQSSQTQPGPSTGSQIAGGAITGAALYNLLFGG